MVEFRLLENPYTSRFTVDKYDTCSEYTIIFLCDRDYCVLDLISIRSLFPPLRHDIGNSVFLVEQTMNLLGRKVG